MTYEEEVEKATRDIRRLAEEHAVNARGFAATLSATDFVVVLVEEVAQLIAQSRIRTRVRIRKARKKEE